MKHFKKFSVNLNLQIGVKFISKETMARKGLANVNSLAGR